MRPSCAARRTGPASATPFPNPATNANVGWLSGRTSSNKGSVSASKQYQKHKEPLFDENVFFDLKNAQAIVVAFDGISPLPPTYCYLKPDFLPVTMTWFDQERIDFDPERIRAVSFEVIIPFLKPIKHLLEAETISEIMVNPDSSVWIEEEARSSHCRVSALTRAHCRPALK